MAEAKIKTFDDFKYEYEKSHPTSHFFDRETLKFFGERLSEMRLLKDNWTVTDVSGEKHVCYVVSSLQRKAPGGRKRGYHCFDVNTLNEVIR